MATLYELTDEYMQLLEMMSDPDMDPQIILDTMEGVGGEIEDKAENYAEMIAILDAQVEACKKQIERLTRLKDSSTANINRMKESLKQAMQTTGKTKFKTELFSFRIQKNPASVQIEEGATIPDKYLIAQEPKIDKRGMIADLKNGEKIEGCTLTQTESLRIA